MMDEKLMIMLLEWQEVFVSGGALFYFLTHIAPTNPCCRGSMCVAYVFLIISDYVFPFVVIIKKGGDC